MHILERALRRKRQQSGEMSDWPKGSEGGRIRDMAPPHDTSSFSLSRPVNSGGDSWRSGGLVEETGPSAGSRWTAHQATFGGTSRRPIQKRSGEIRHSGLSRPPSAKGEAPQPSVDHLRLDRAFRVTRAYTPINGCGPIGGRRSFGAEQEG
ncbi:hypothetical protein LY76DRAFT_221348 [Colletotrichum caudatum]|nr:hypothetical protein LY76DRAFT_221348 [Colletotrichum caudatum]